MLEFLMGAATAGMAALLTRYVSEERPEPRGVADLLPYGFMVADGVVLNKNGSLLAGWRYRGPDPAAATVEELDALSAHLANAFGQVGDGWGFHVTEERRESVGYPAAGAFPDPVSRLIDEERRRSYESAGAHYESDYFLVATYFPPAERYAQLVSLFVEGAEERTVDWDLVLGQFERELGQLGDRLSGRLEMERLCADALLGHLHSCLTGLHHPVRMPVEGSYLNHVLADQDLVGGFEPRIGEKHVSVVSIPAMPRRSEPAMLGVLSRLPFAFRWTSRFVLLSTEAAASEIKNARRGWRLHSGVSALTGGSAGGASARNQPEESGATDPAEDAEDALRLNGSGLVRFMFYTSCVVLYEEDAARADACARELLRVLNDLGFTGRIERVNATDAFLGSLPGIFSRNLRRPLIHTANLGDLFPSTAQWAGMEHNPSPFLPEGSPPLMMAETAGSTPFRLNTDISDVGHALVLGPPRSGKSVLLNLHAMQARRYPDAQTVMFDVGYSAWLPSVAAGALHYDFGGSLKLQPLANVHVPAEAAWAREWIEGLLAQQGHDCDARDREIIDKAIRFLGRQPKQHRTISELQVQVQSGRMRAALEPYLGSMLDGDEDGISDSSHLVFEMGALMRTGRTVLTPTLMYLLHRVDLLTVEGVRPTWTYLDEVHVLLADPMFERHLGLKLATDGKNNNRLILATQSLAQIEHSAIRHLIFETCQTKILLPNPEAATSSRALYHEIGLNEAEIRSVAMATPKRDYFLRSPLGRRVFSLGIGPAAARFLFPQSGLTIPQTRRLAMELREELGSGWPGEWLRRGGLGHWVETMTEASASNQAGIP